MANATNDTSSSTSSSNPLSLDAAAFDVDTYLQQTLKTKKLDDLMEIELAMFKDVRSLEQQMEQLVYENYAKFITATDTIRQMQTDFVAIEEQMDKLSSNMSTITQLSDRLGAALADKRDGVARLSTASRTLKSLQCLFDLPQTLQALVDKQDYGACARTYVRTRATLQQYGDAPALAGIAAECAHIVEEHVRKRMQRRLMAKDPDDKIDAESDGEDEDHEDSEGRKSKAITEAVECLLLLGDAPDTLVDAYLARAQAQLAARMAKLQRLVDSNSKSNDTSTVDVLEFVDVHVSALLGELQLTVAAFVHMFAAAGGQTTTPHSDEQSPMVRRVLHFVTGALADVFTVCERRFVQEVDQESGGPDDPDSALLVRAIDRFYRRLAATSQVMPGATVAYQTSSVSVIVRVAERHVDAVARRMTDARRNHVRLARTQLAAITAKSTSSSSSSTLPPPPGAEKTTTETTSTTNAPLNDILVRLEDACVHDVKLALGNLLQYTTCDVTFAVQEPTRFVRPFAAAVRARLMTAAVDGIVQVCDEYCAGGEDKQYVNATLILVLAKLCKNFEVMIWFFLKSFFQCRTIARLFELCDKQLEAVVASSQSSSLSLSQRSSVNLATTSHTNTSSEAAKVPAAVKSMGAAAQRLVERYVQLESTTLSQLMIKSMDARAWLACAEPRSVRAVAKRTVEDVRAIDARVGQLFTNSMDSGSATSGSGSRRSAAHRIRSAHSALISRKSQHQNRQMLTTASDHQTSIGARLWTERVDFAAAVDVTRASIVAACVTRALKTMLECVRVCTFSVYGFQQIQVDCHYLREHLQQFAAADDGGGGGDAAQDNSLAIEHLLDEIVTSAEQRCFVPPGEKMAKDVRMMHSVIESICART